MRVTFIINDEGRLVSNSKKFPMLTNISPRSYIKKIIHSGDSQGFFVDRVDGQKSLITYTVAG